jgi:hypothetical protein
MSAAISVGTMIRQIEGLHDTGDVTEWENGFIESVVTKTQSGNDTRGLSEKQIETVERIWRKHFA